MKNKCSKCGKNCENEYCFQHKPRKPLSKYRTILQSVGDDEDEEDDSMTMKLFFTTIWNERKHVSEISNTPLGREPLMTFFHHCAPKWKYPEGKFDEENIIILTPEEHEQVENDVYAYQAVTDIRERMIEKYENTKRNEKSPN